MGRDAGSRPGGEAGTGSVAELLEEQEHRLLWTRRKVAPLVLAAARAAGDELREQPGTSVPVAADSLPEGGTRPRGGQDAARDLLGRVSSRSQRILRDAIAYDQGARVSMYWGPIERKHDAIHLLHELRSMAGSPAGITTTGQDGDG